MRRPHVSGSALAPSPRTRLDPHFRRASCPGIMSTEIRSRIFRVLFLALSQTTRVGRSELQKFLWSLGDSTSHSGLLLPLSCPPPSRNRTGTGPRSPEWVQTLWTSPQVVSIGIPRAGDQDPFSMPWSSRRTTAGVRPGRTAVLASGSHGIACFLGTGRGDAAD